MIRSFRFPALVAVALALVAGVAAHAAPVLAAEPVTPGFDRSRVAFVIHDGGVPWLVLRRSVDPSWGEGTLTLLDREVALRTPAVEARLPKELAAWKGRALRLYGQDGRPSCSATVRDLHVMVRYVAHFGTVQQWNGEGGEPRFDDAKVAEAAWEQANEGDRFLVGRLEAARGEVCKGAVFARPSDTPAPTLVGPRADPDARLRVAALKRLRGLPAWKTAQKGYVAEVEKGRSATWDTHDGATPDVRVFGAPTAKVRYVWVGATAGEGCGGYSDQMWAVWAIHEEGKTARWTPLVEDSSQLGWFVPNLAADLDGDGAVELLDSVRILEPRLDAPVPSESVELNSYDCPC